MHLVVQVRSRTFSGASHLPYLFSSHYLLPFSYTYLAEMSVTGYVAEAMIYSDAIAIQSFPSGFLHRTVARGINRRAHVGREVHPA